MSPTTITNSCTPAGNGPYRIQSSVLHIDIRDGKMWIQHDGTGDGIAEELVKAGIPRDRIVLAYKPPEIRVCRT